MNRNWIWIGTLALAALGIAAQGKINGSGTRKTESRKVASFTKVKLEGVAGVSIVVGKPLSVTVTADDNVLSRVGTTVTKGELLITTKDEIRTKKAIQVQITVPNLTDAAIEGGAVGSFSVKGIRTPRFTFSLSGTGSLDAEGTTDSLILSVEGTGACKLFGLKAKDVKVSLDGTGSVETSASHSLIAAIDGTGNIIYRGNPKVTKSVDGIGNVTKG